MFENGKFCWNELVTGNIQEAKKFYGELLGWKFIDHNMGDTTYTMIQLKDNEIGGMWAIPNERKNQITPHWMTYILVENLDQSLEKATKLGASLVKPATQAGDFGRFAIISDPTGAHIAFWQPLKNK